MSQKRRDQLLKPGNPGNQINQAAAIGRLSVLRPSTAPGIQPNYQYVLNAQPALSQGNLLFWTELNLETRLSVTNNAFNAGNNHSRISSFMGLQQ